MVSTKELATNRKAYHEYFIEETYEAGIELTGSEVKSIRAHKVNLKDGYVRIQNGQAWLENVHIAQYTQANRMNHDPLRPRRLLLHKKEIMHLLGKIQMRGYTLIPLRMYLKGSLIKVEIGLCRGKKLYDKRRAIAERETRREIERAIKYNM